jgi:hypothetical protein
VRILRLDRILPGDVILETGSRLIAAATGGPYGHASVALGKLVKIEAENVDSGVVVNPFNIEAWRRGEERVVGVLVEGELIVLRKIEIDLGTVTGEALWESGRHYSLRKLLALHDLLPRHRERIERLLENQPTTADDDSEGRFCSEVAARILRLPHKNLSPNQLAASSGLQQVTGAIADLGDDWIAEPVETARDTVAALVSELRLGLAKRAIDQATKMVERLKAESTSQTSAVAELDGVLTEEISDAIQVLKQIRALEPTVLHTETSAI